MKVDLTIAGITFEGVDLPDANTPLPPSNATHHILKDDVNYGTSERSLVMFCGVSWLTREGSGGQHAWVGADEHWWHKHVTCDACRAEFQKATGAQS